MMTNSRVFGHHLAGVDLAGGAHALLSNNIIGCNSIAGPNASSGVIVRAGVSDFIIQGNHVGNVFKGSSAGLQRHGVEIALGASDNYVVSGNTLVGNAGAGISDSGTGPHKQVQGNVG